MSAMDSSGEMILGVIDDNDLEAFAFLDDVIQEEAAARKSTLGVPNTNENVKLLAQSVMKALALMKSSSLDCPPSIEKSEKPSNSLSSDNIEPGEILSSSEDDDLKFSRTDLKIRNVKTFYNTNVTQVRCDCSEVTTENKYHFESSCRHREADDNCKHLDKKPRHFFGEALNTTAAENDRYYELEVSRQHVRSLKKKRKKEKSPSTVPKKWRNYLLDNATLPVSPYESSLFCNEQTLLHGASNGHDSDVSISSDKTVKIFHIPKADAEQCASPTKPFKYVGLERLSTDLELQPPTPPLICKPKQRKEKIKQGKHKVHVQSVSPGSPNDGTFIKGERSNSLPPLSTSCLKPDPPEPLKRRQRSASTYQLRTEKKVKKKQKKSKETKNIVKKMVNCMSPMCDVRESRSKSMENDVWPQEERIGPQAAPLPVASEEHNGPTESGINSSIASRGSACLGIKSEKQPPWFKTIVSNTSNGKTLASRQALRRANTGLPLEAESGAVSPLSKSDAATKKTIRELTESTAVSLMSLQTGNLFPSTVKEMRKSADISRSVLDVLLALKGLAPGAAQGGSDAATLLASKESQARPPSPGREPGEGSKMSNVDAVEPFPSSLPECGLLGNPSGLSRSRPSSTSKPRSQSKSKSRSRSSNKQRSQSKSKSRSRSSNKQRSQSKIKSRSRSLNKQRSQSKSKSRSRSMNKQRSQSKSKSRTRSSNKRRSRSTIKRRSYSSSKRRSRSTSKRRSRCKSKQSRSSSNSASRARRQTSRPRLPPRSRSRTRTRSNSFDWIYNPRRARGIRSNSRGPTALRKLPYSKPRARRILSRSRSISRSRSKSIGNLRRRSRSKSQSRGLRSRRGDSRKRSIRRRSSSSRSLTPRPRRTSRAPDLTGRRPALSPPGLRKLSERRQLLPLLMATGVDAALPALRTADADSTASRAIFPSTATSNGSVQNGFEFPGHPPDVLPYPLQSITYAVQHSYQQYHYSTAPQVKNQQYHHHPLTNIFGLSANPKHLGNGYQQPSNNFIRSLPFTVPNPNSNKPPGLAMSTPETVQKGCYFPASNFLRASAPKLIPPANSCNVVLTGNVPQPVCRNERLENRKEVDIYSDLMESASVRKSPEPSSPEEDFVTHPVVLVGSRKVMGRKPVRDKIVINLLSKGIREEGNKDKRVDPILIDISASDDKDIVEPDLHNTGNKVINVGPCTTGKGDGRPLENGEAKKPGQGSGRINANDYCINFPKDILLRLRKAVLPPKRSVLTQVDFLKMDLQGTVDVFDPPQNVELEAMFDALRDSLQ